MCEQTQLPILHLVGSHDTAGPDLMLIFSKQTISFIITRD